MATLAEEIAAVLKTHGVERIFGIPGGGSSLDIIDAADKAGIPFILNRTEAAASIMAAVTGELTSAPGAFLVGVGPGASSATNGVAYAYLERSQMVLFIDGPASSMHQHFAQQELFKPITKDTARLMPENGAERLDELLTLSNSAPEGPVMVELTASDAASECVTLQQAAPSISISPSTNYIEHARSMIDASERPLVIVGLEARAHAEDVRAFVASIGAAAMTTYKAGGVIAASDPAFIGCITGAAGEMSIMALADLIIGVGFDPIEFIPGQWPESAPPFLNLTTGAPQNPRIPFAHEVVGPLPETLNALASERSKNWPDDAQAEAKAIIKSIYDDPSAGFSTADVIDVLSEKLDHGTRVCVDAGAHMFSTIGRWPAEKPFGILKSNGLSTMGYALPAAIASKLCDPDTPAIAVTGDGGMSMCLGELAKELDLDITVFVINDSALSLIDIKQQRQQRPSRGVRYPVQDFAAIAEASGWQAHVVYSADELRKVVSMSGQTLIDIRIDPAGYGEDMTRLRG